MDDASREIRVHTLDGMSTSRAYDRSQCSDEIGMGDVLVVPEERVVGFLLAAWPTAVTVACGEFHHKIAGVNWEALCGPNSHDPRDWTPCYRKAVEVAKGLGYEVAEG